MSEIQTNEHDDAYALLENRNLKVFTNKKTNMEYWDMLEAEAKKFLLAMAVNGGIDIKELESCHMQKELVEKAVALIEVNFPKAQFPVVNENY